MMINDALNAIIDDGIEAARTDYSKPRDNLKRDGAIKGFEECRGKSPAEIQDLIRVTNEHCTQAHREQAHDYWYWRCRAAEVEWVANVLSCILQANGYPPISIMTVGGMMKAAEIIGVAESVESQDRKAS